MTPNLYAVENFFVLDTTSADVSKRKDITQEVLTAAEVPGAPEANCYYLVITPSLLLYLRRYHLSL